MRRGHDGPPDDGLPEVSRYRVTGRLGRGGMGVVFRATDRLTGRQVALKRLVMSPPEAAATVAMRPPVVGHEPTLSRTPEPLLDTEAATIDGEPRPDRPSPSDRIAALALAQEFRILASLRHPNIIGVLDYGFDAGGEPFVAMELLDRAVPINLAAAGRDLAGRVDLLVQLLQALAYLHRRGILHRDLKPSNVLVVGGVVRVLDFGLALERGRRAITAGTAGYIAPEVIGGDPASEASDLFAFGVIAFEVLSGDHPFHGDDERATLRETLSTEPKLRLPPGIAAEAPALAALAELVGRLLARDPARRPASAGQTLRLLCHATGRDVPESDVLRDSVVRGARFVGRAAERARLIEALHQARRGAGSVWQVVGESGAGKSRLLDELRTTALVTGALVLRGAEIRDGGFPYHAWRAVLRPLVLDLGAAARDVAWPFLSLVLPDLGELLGLGHLTPPPLDPQTLQLQLQHEVEALFRRSPRPIVLLLDDTHWAGAESAALLAHLARVAPSLPLLIVAAGQGDAVSGAARIDLARLGRSELTELAVSVVGELGARADLVDLLVRNTAGNPLFAIEVLRTLADRAGAIDRIADMLLPDQVAPAAVEDAIRERLGRLPDDVRRLLAHAAVIGTEIDGDLLDEVAPGHDLARWYPACQHLGLLDVDGPRWRFTHARVREALFDAIGPDERRALHARVAAALEPRGAAWAPQLAYHWGEAGDEPREAEWSATAGAALLRTAAYARAIRLLERALALLPARELDGPARAAAELEIQLGLGTSALVVRGHASDAMKAAFDRAAALCDQVGASGGQLAFQVLWGQAAYFLFRGEVGTSLELAERALAIADELGDVDLQVEGRFSVANAQLWAGRLADAQANVERVLALWRDDRAPVHAARFGQIPRVTVMTAGVWGQAIAGRPADALAAAREAIEIAVASGHGFSEAIARQILGVHHALCREPGPTRTVADELIQQGGMFPSYLITARVLGAWARAAAGKDPAALEEMIEAWATWHAMGCGLAHTLIGGLIGDAHLALGRPADALATARDALAWADVHGERALVADLRRIEGEALIATGDRDGGVAALEAGLAEAEQTGAHLLALRVAVALGWQLVARGRVDDAIARVSAARARVDAPAGAPDAHHADELLRRIGALGAS